MLTPSAHRLFSGGLSEFMQFQGLVRNRLRVRTREALGHLNGTLLSLIKGSVVVLSVLSHVTW